MWQPSIATGPAEESPCARFPSARTAPTSSRAICHLQVTIGTDAEGESARWEWATNSAHPASFVLCCSVLGRWRLCRRPGLAPQRLDQGLELDIVRLNPRKLFGIVQRARDIPLIATISDQRGERVVIARMLGEVVLERLDRIATAPI